MPIRRAHLIAALSLLVAGAALADTAPPQAAPETMAERRLKEIAEHQKVMFSDAVAQGSELEEAEFKNKVEQITREYESLLRDNPDFAAGYASYGYMLWKAGMRKPAVALNRIPMFRRNPDTGVTERRRLAVRVRSTLRTRS